MTTSLQSSPTGATPASGPDWRGVARVELLRALRLPWLWCGIAATIAFIATNGDANYQSGQYFVVMASFVATAAGVFITGVLVGGRDSASSTGDELAPAAPVTAEERSLARLVAMGPVVAVATAAILGIWIWTRLRGGFWIGDAPRRTESHHYGIAEMAQPVLLCVLAASAAVAIGRRVHRPELAAGVGALVILAIGTVFWVRPGLWAVLSPLMVQPFSVDLMGYEVSKTPSDWWLSSPTPYHIGWQRVVISQWLATWHDLYLIGWSTLSAGTLMAGRRRMIVVAVGAVLAVVGAVGTSLAMPSL